MPDINIIIFIKSDIQIISNTLIYLDMVHLNTMQIIIPTQENKYTYFIKYTHN